MDKPAQFAQTNICENIVISKFYACELRRVTRVDTFFFVHETPFTEPDSFVCRSKCTICVGKLFLLCN